ncbi:MAG: DNA topoisomerase I [Halobacteriales archaeon]|nr:DNA topoisomerase I [Halobacteriales archaeon]
MAKKPKPEPNAQPEEAAPEAAADDAKPVPPKRKAKKAKPKQAAPENGTEAGEPESPRAKVIPGDLIIAEKNLAAKKLADLLGDGKVKKGKVKGVDTYDITWQGGRRATLIGLKGHIVELTYPKKYKSWQRVPLQELVLADPERIVKEKGIGDALKTLARDAERVIIATDFDREGELIGVEALEQVKKARTEPFEVKRARYSAFTKTEISRAFGALSKLDMNLADSAHARQVVDLAWGAVLTRFISLASSQYGQDYLSVGRVQSPTLAVLVDKEKEIRKFVPTPYWEFSAKLHHQNIDFLAGHAHGRYDTEAEAQAVHARIQGADQAKVQSVEKKERRERAPEPFNTTAFLAAATRLGLSAARAMNLAEGLYMKGLLSYPRTDNTEYPSSLPLKDMVQKLTTSQELGHLAERILEQPELKPTSGKKRDPAHPPITPQESASKVDLQPDEWKVYELVTRRFLATLAPDAKLLNIKAVFDIRGEAFSSTGMAVLEAGWKAYYPYSGAKESILPPLREGEQVRVLGIDLDAKMTQPPKRISQGKLLELMEELGLGTKSTRHEIIKKLYDRGYIQNSPPQPGEAAFAVVEALENHAPHIAKPDMTAQLEREMDEIAEGQKTLVDVVGDSRKLLSEVLVELEANRQPIGDSIREALREQAIIGRCVRCSKGLMVRKARTGKRFVGCSGYPECTQTYPVPQYGRIQKTATMCAACDAPVIKILNPGRRPWVLCVNMQCPNREKKVLETKLIPGTEPQKEMPDEPVPELEAEAEAPGSDAPTEVEEKAVE